MKEYKWTDNPTEADVSAYNPDVLNECLMHLKYNNIPAFTTKYCFNSGNTDEYGNADLVKADLSTNIEYASPGQYSFTAPASGYYSVIMVGGGGTSASGFTSMSTISYAGGGSGAAFVGEIYLAAGIYSVSVGNAGSNNNTGIDNVIVVGGGGNATLVNYNLLAANQQGGTVTINTATRNVTVNKAGNAGGFSNGNVPQNGGASVYHGFGKGADSGKGSGASCGYFSIKLKAENYNISYKVGGIYPVLNGTLADGEKFVVNGINSDDAELLSNGTYIKYVGKDGSSELLNTNFFVQSQSPDASIGDIWLNTAAEPLQVLQWDGTEWQMFNKVPIASITVANASVTASSTFPYNQNGYNTNMKSPLGKPSGKYVDLTLPASGGTVIAPYNGHVQLAVLTCAALQIYNGSRSSYWNAVSNLGGKPASVSVPCQKGDMIQVYYEGITLRWFRCYADEGAI